MKKLWGTRLAANFDFVEDDIFSSEWEWIKSPIAETLREVEKWDLLADLVTVVKRKNLMEVRAYFPKPFTNAACPDSAIVPRTKRSNPWRDIYGKFEFSVWCVECKKQRDHDVDTCRVADVMDS
jgi:hypothetical protein